MRTKKTPAPRRAGTETKTANDDRATREEVALEQLDELRVIAPEIYTEMLNLLATIVAKCERKKRRSARQNRTKF